MTSHNDWPTSGSSYEDPDVACEAYWDHYRYHGDETLVLEDIREHESVRGMDATWNDDADQAEMHRENAEAMSWAADIVDDPDVAEEL